MTLREKKLIMEQKRGIKRCAKALYITGGTAQMCIYLAAMADAEWLTEKEADAMADAISEECATMTVKEIAELAAKFN